MVVPDPVWDLRMGVWAPVRIPCELCAEYSTKCFLCIVSLVPKTNKQTFRIWCLYAHPMGIGAFELREVKKLVKGHTVRGEQGLNSDYPPLLETGRGPLAQMNGWFYIVDLFMRPWLGGCGL